MKKVYLNKIIDDMKLEIVEKFTNNEVSTCEVNRVGLQLVGHYEYFDPGRIQIIGQSEMSFFLTLSNERRIEVMKEFACKKIVCLIITRNMEVPYEIIRVFKEYKVNILRTKLKTTHFISKLTDYMEDRLAPTKTLHGVLVDVYGIGVLIFGKSGIGKSETALELIKRGHRFIADDAVEIKRTPEDSLMGKAPELIKNFLEIRGIGILDISKLYGIGAVMNDKTVDLIVNFKEWRDEEPYDRLGMEQKYAEILGIKVASLDIPVKPGRNLAIILEAAARNHKQKLEGYNAAEELDNRLRFNKDTI